MMVRVTICCSGRATVHGKVANSRKRNPESQLFAIALDRVVYLRIIFFSTIQIGIDIIRGLSLANVLRPSVMLHYNLHLDHTHIIWLCPCIYRVFITGSNNSSSAYSYCCLTWRLPPTLLSTRVPLFHAASSLPSPQLYTLLIYRT